APELSYEWSRASGKVPDGSWLPLGDIATPGVKAKEVIFFRTTASAQGGVYTPASKMFKVTAKGPKN
ncbi:MAG: hypothetical protein FWH04_10145, partial [Oscillospiraceae bacterium]|nr:hypothetical protein [Oscillospiraceae bacterium]MCL2082206.1 hypothetical protein [Oscillospiraceae bacterium]MCL2083574.1 hypothetical protein [Oscillospiraceae bacterium]